MAERKIQPSRRWRSNLFLICNLHDGMMAPFLKKTTQKVRDWCLLSDIILL